MTDRELLELAAKAIGITLRYNYFGSRDAMQPWDPLIDDGDALRLAVKLKIRIGFSPCAYADTPSGVRFFGAHESDDVDEKIRRAIVRAAAEIGKGDL